MPVQWIQFGIDSHPKHFRITSLERPFQQVERFFGTTERARYQCQMIRGDVTPLGKRVHVVESSLCRLEISGGRISTAEPRQCVRRLTPELDTAFRGFDGFVVAAEGRQNETRAVKHHQISRLVLEGGAGETIRFIKSKSVIRTPDDAEPRDDRQWIEIPPRVRFAQRLTETSFHRELK